MDVPGTDLPKVFTRLDDPTPFFGRDVLVVGGGNSAATGAMTLAEAGARVTVAMRRAPADFQSHLRPFIVRDLKIMAEEKRLTLLTDVRVKAITPTAVELAHIAYAEATPSANADRWNLPNDFVFALIGHTADRTLFAHLGVPLAAGRPARLRQGNLRVRRARPLHRRVACPAPTSSWSPAAARSRSSPMSPSG